MEEVSREVEVFDKAGAVIVPAVHIQTAGTFSRTILCLDSQ